MIDWESARALLLAALCGGAIGLEREIHGHPAGLRTHILVALGAALATVVSLHMHSIYGSSADPGRIAAQVIAGIGFLGAGAIIREGTSIKGLTTAAGLWTTAVIGLAAAAAKTPGMLGVVALTTAIMVSVLWGLHIIESCADRRRVTDYRLSVHIKIASGDLEAVVERITASGWNLGQMRVEPIGDTDEARLICRIGSITQSTATRLPVELARLDGVASASIDPDRRR